MLKVFISEETLCIREYPKSMENDIIKNLEKGTYFKTSEKIIIEGTKEQLYGVLYNLSYYFDIELI